MKRERIERDLRRHPVPGERAAAERSWEVVRAALAEREHEPAATRRSARRRMPLRLALAVAALGTLALALALTPAGATVRDWVRSAVGDGSEVPARPALSHLPSGGRLLVDSAAGQWVVGEDGSRRFLGRYESSAWSPNGLYVAVARDEQLVAVEPDGALRWSLTAPAGVEDQTWAPGCCRIAYRSGGGLRVVDGAGAGDRELAHAVAPVAPAWMPVPYDDASRNVLAYVDAAGGVQVVDVDSGQRLASIAAREQPISLGWLDRDRILAVERSGLEILPVDGGPARQLRPAGGGRIEGAAIAPRGGRIAILARTGGGESARSTLLLADPASPAGRQRRIFSGSGRYSGPTFSPDGSRILVGWRETDQWLFVSPERGVDPIAVGDIARQFDPGSRGPSELPRVEGWCCG